MKKEYFWCARCGAIEEFLPSFWTKLDKMYFCDNIHCRTACEYERRKADGEEMIAEMSKLTGEMFSKVIEGIAERGKPVALVIDGQLVIGYEKHGIISVPDDDPITEIWDEKARSNVTSKTGVRSGSGIGRPVGHI